MNGRCRCGMVAIALAWAAGFAHAADAPVTGAKPPAAAAPAPASKSPAAAPKAAAPAAPASAPKAAAAAPDAATIDCKNAKPQFRSRCVELQRVQTLCGMYKDDAKKACIQKNLHYAKLKADCSLSKTPQGKDKCLQNNRMLDTAVACEGKSGDALKACAAAHPVPRPGK